MTRPALCSGCFALALLSTITLTAGTSAAADYPERPVRLIIPFASGSATDTSARLYALELSKQMGQQVVPDNRPGAGGAIGMQQLAKSAADGYTIGYAGAGPLAINRSVTPNLPYDVDKDFQFISQAVDAPLMMAVSPTLPVKTVKDLIALAKAKPGQLAYGSAGTGTIGHLAGEYFRMKTGADILHVAYKGGAQAAIDVMSGNVQLIFDPINGVSPNVKSGRLRGLAVTGLKRAKAFPEIPTVAESGVKGFEVTTWGGMIAPAGTPAAIITRLNAEMQKAAKSSFVNERYAALGAEPVAGTPEQFATLVRTETAKWAEVVKRANLN
ncbi:MAG: Bug family tripartite tricarboxylate transporter substrate binding protein [Hypericibacter sp.]